MRALDSLRFRIPLIFIGALVLTIAGLAGFGFALRSKPELLSRWLGRDRYSRWVGIYQDAMAGLLPGDADGDGVCDGLELWSGTDPHNPLDSPTWDMHVVWDQGGFLIHSRAPMQDGDSRWSQDFLYFGERRTLRGRILLANGFRRFRWKFNLRIAAENPLTLAAPGEPPAGNVVFIPISADGSFSVDVLVPPSVPPGSAPERRVERRIQVENAINRFRLGEVVATILKPLKPVNPTVTVGPPVPVNVRGEYKSDYRWNRVGKPYCADPSRLFHEHCFYSLQMPADYPRECDIYVLEVARDEPGAEWFRDDCSLLEGRPIELQQYAGHPAFPYTGPLKFRVRPAGFQP